MFNVFARHAAQSAVLMFNCGRAYGESIRKYRRLKTRFYGNKLPAAEGRGIRISGRPI
jgi:hypothetical protein